MTTLMDAARRAGGAHAWFKSVADGVISKTRDVRDAVVFRLIADVVGEVAQRLRR